MTKSPPTDIGAAVRARLSRLARERGEDFQLVLTRYANERLLFRLASSRHAHRFVLKGAALFTLWTGKPHRATRDLDLLGFGDPGVDHVREVFAGELVEAVASTSYGQSESDVRPDRYKGLREDVRFTGNEDDVEVGLVAFAKRTYAPALGRWASPDPPAVHAPGEADADGPRAGPRSPAIARTLRSNAGFASARFRGAGLSRGPRAPAKRAP